MESSPIIPIVILAIVLAFIALASQNNQSNNSQVQVSGTQSDNNSSCDASLWQHVYKPARLKVLSDCMTVSGTIDAILVENDGDYHIRLRLDSQYSSLLNGKNISGQRGDLVLEPVCQNEVKQQDAIDACRGFENRIAVPPRGSHVKVVGSYVLDTEHGWNELHPVTRLEAG